MDVETEQFEDVGEADADGFVDYEYRGFIYYFREGGRTLKARRYDDTPSEAAFLCWDEPPGRFDEIPDDALFAEAVRYFRSEGVAELSVLLPGGYRPVRLDRYG